MNKDAYNIDHCYEIRKVLECRQIPSSPFIQEPLDQLASHLSSVVSMSRDLDAVDMDVDFGRIDAINVVQKSR